MPGKDSHRHRMAGASEVIVASDTGWARIAAGSEPASLQILLAQLRPVDVVLVEGFKQLEGLRRVEVFRGEARRWRWPTRASRRWPCPEVCRPPVTAA